MTVKIPSFKIYGNLLRVSSCSRWRDMTKLVGACCNILLRKREKRFKWSGNSTYGNGFH